MPAINPEIKQWINQLGDKVEAVAFFAYQSLQEAVLRAGAPGHAEEQVLLANTIGTALTSLARQSGPGAVPASIVGNAFLAAVANQTVPYLHPARARVQLARLLGYLPNEAVVPHLKLALEDLEARDMARCSLEGQAAESATAALVEALDAVGGVFRVGVVNSLAKRRGEKVVAALRRAVDDAQPEVRLAALEALADIPDAAHDGLIEKAAHAVSPLERSAAHVARARLAESLRASGDKAASQRVYKAILASEAAEPQKRAARLALGA